jgi:hypothetical protein
VRARLVKAFLVRLGQMEGRMERIGYRNQGRWRLADQTGNQ